MPRCPSRGRTHRVSEASSTAIRPSACGAEVCWSMSVAWISVKASGGLVHRHALRACGDIIDEVILRNRYAHLVPAQEVVQPPELPALLSARRRRYGAVSGSAHSFRSHVVMWTSGWNEIAPGLWSQSLELAGR